MEMVPMAGIELATFALRNTHTPHKYGDLMQ